LRKAGSGQDERSFAARFVARLSYANVMATAAMFFALGGGAYAALKVTGRNVVDGSLTGKDIKNHSILPVDLRSPVASQGPAGAKGDKGDKGDAGVVGDVTMHTATVSVPAHTAAGDWDNRSVQANCDSGEKGIAGGTNWAGEGDTNQLITVLSTPIYDSGNKKITGWRARGGNDTATAHNFEVEVLCVKA
jgi:hypothetical protein